MEAVQAWGSQRAAVPGSTPVQLLQPSEAHDWQNHLDPTEDEEQGPYPLSYQEDKDHAFRIELERQPLNGVSQMMGRSYRSPITGEITLRVGSATLPDFFIVDLKRRPRLPPRLSNLLEDPYLFRPVALPYRTWVYHEVVRIGGELGVEASFTSTDESGLVRKALMQSCIDVPLGGGRSSSLRCFAPVFLATALTADVLVMFATVVVMALMYFISLRSNSLHYYRYERGFSLLVRLPFLAFLCARFHINNIIATCGYVLTILAWLADFFLFDLAVISSYRWYCRYEVLKELPNRVYICKRYGASDMDHLPDKGFVDECISGFSPWEPTNALMADIGGLIVELRPISPEAWVQARAEFLRTKAALPYVGLDSFGKPGEERDDYVEDEDEVWREKPSTSNLSSSGRGFTKSYTKSFIFSEGATPEEARVQLRVEDL